MIQNAPTVINVKDLSDFNNLCHHFALKTPQSFRKVKKKNFSFKFFLILLRLHLLDENYRLSFHFKI